MNKVEQRLFFDAETGQRGDCLKCCLASLLELDYDEVPHFAQMEDWYGELLRWLKARGWGIFNVQAGNEVDPQRPASWPSGGYWLATVASPRIVHLDGSRGTHMVVMCEDEVVWDPHPERDGGHLGFLSGYLLRPFDPARFVLREAA